MLIVSDFYDYYDAIAKTVCDRQVVYNRRTTIVAKETTFHKRYPLTNMRSFKYPRSLVYGILNRRTDIAPFVIGFCGKIYPGVMYYIDAFKKYERHLSYAFSLCDLDSAIRNSGNNHAIKAYFEDRPGHHYENSAARNDVERHFDNHTEGMDVFEKYKTPIFFSGYTSIYDSHSSVTQINPFLGGFHFQKVIDPYTAFTELYMYVSGVVGGGDKQIPDVSNDDMLRAKGFDPKWSFRKPPKE